MKNFLIQGGRKLSGEVLVAGSKNAVLPIICATLLTKEVSVLLNVPDIEDVHQMIKILNFLQVKTDFKDGVLTLDPTGLENRPIPHELVCKMRASILLLGPLLARFNEAEMGFPGGCVLGKRSVSTHINAFRKLGAELVANESKIHLKAKKLTGAEVVLSEASVTATENLILMAVMSKGNTIIKSAACEPHVKDLCYCLNSMGAKIEGVGTHTLIIQGVSELAPTHYRICSDYLEAGTLILAACVTNSQVEVTDFDADDLDVFIEKLEEMGVELEKFDYSVKVHSARNLKPLANLKTAVFPGFPTDLLAPFSVLLTQANGVSKIFETLFEGRFNYLFELEKMNAKVELLNPHQGLIVGPTPLSGIPVSSCDIRAGAAVVLAGLMAEGETLITNINYIDRGYVKLDEKLNSLGAKIKRVGNL